MSDADELQRQAREILDGSRFHERRTPGPFAGPLRRLGDFLDPALGPIGRVIARIVGALGDWWAEPLARVILVGAVVAVAVVVCVLIIRRRTAVSFARGGNGQGAGEQDPEVLERAAAEAEVAGAFDDAVRLRFQAGVLRLQRDGHVRRGRSTPTRAIGQQLHLAEFDRLGRSFDEVAYGGRHASASDAAEARQSWERVRAETGKRA